MKIAKNIFAFGCLFIMIADAFSIKSNSKSNTNLKSENLNSIKNKYNKYDLGK
jgi:hypothetical protein